MCRFFLSSGFVLFVLGALTVSSAQARPWWRGSWYGYSYPAYSYAAPQTVYYPPSTDYVAPAPYVAPQPYVAPPVTTYYAPAYSPGYVYRPAYRGYWYGGYRGWRR